MKYMESIYCMGCKYSMDSIKSMEPMDCEYL